MAADRRPEDLRGASSDERSTARSDIAAAARSGDATPDAAWKAGLLYFNPADPAVFVETRMGVGWTVNFGNIWSWVFLAFALAVPMLVLRLMR
jgi:uncharacterized membrane protein